MNGCFSARSVPGRFIAAAFAVSLLTFGGCATQEKKDEQIRPVWPGPPLTARIKFVRSIVSDEDVGRDTTFSDNLIEFLAGGKPPPNRIGQPTGIAVSEDGNRVYIADNLQNAVFIFDFEKKAFGKIDGISQPVGVALDADENLYVAAAPVRMIVKYDRNGKRLGEITDPSLERPTGLAIDKQNKRLYVVDTVTTRTAEASVKVFDLNGKMTGEIRKEAGTPGGPLVFPTYITVDAKNNLYVTDTFNGRVEMFDSSGKFLRSFGQLGDAWGNFDKPKGVATDEFGNLYVVDTGWSNVQIFNQKGQVLLFFGGRGSTPGFLGNPTSIAIDKRNRIYVGDYFNHRVEVYDLVNTTAADSNIQPPSNNPVGKPAPAKPAAAKPAPAKPGDAPAAPGAATTK